MAGTGETGAAVTASAGDMPVSRVLNAVLTDCWQKSEAERFGLSQQAFSSTLLEVGAKYLPSGASDAEQARFYSGLHLRELALARACAAGIDSAWDHFLCEYRARLYEFAHTVTREESSARELADSIYAELYGLSERDGKRTSKLAYYTGRGSLEGWLRTVLAQEHVNRYRRTKQNVSLEEQVEAGTQFQAEQPAPIQPVAPQVEAATDEALVALSSEERYVLASYYLDGRTLAEIARSLGVHESTISRKLDKLTRTLRARILKNLRRAGMSQRQAEEALDFDVRDLRLDIRARLAQETRGQPFSTGRENTAGQ